MSAENLFIYFLTGVRNSNGVYSETSNRQDHITKYNSVQSPYSIAEHSESPQIVCVLRRLLTICFFAYSRTLLPMLLGRPVPGKLCRCLQLLIARNVVDRFSEGTVLPLFFFESLFFLTGVWFVLT